MATQFNPQALALRDFSKSTARQLFNRGFELRAPVSLPDESGSFLNPIRGYELIDQSVGGSFIRTFAQVLKLAETGEGAPTWE